MNTENLPLGVLRIRGTLEEVDTTMEQYRELIDEMVDNELQNYKKMYLKERKIKHLIGIGENYPVSVSVRGRWKSRFRGSRESSLKSFTPA